MPLIRLESVLEAYLRDRLLDDHYAPTGEVVFDSEGGFSLKGDKMDLEGTEISCGIAQLFNIQNSSAKRIRRKLAEEDGSSAFVIASLTKKQKKARKRLKKQGFVRVTRWRINPNSDNLIALFVKEL